MELRNGPVSIFKIIFYALKVANQTFGTVLGLLILMVVFVALLAGIPRCGRALLRRVALRRIAAALRRARLARLHVPLVHNRA